ncbi:MAG TPA: hypothetical protein DCG75_16040 [Bacteroidales bacterium]|nr:hypothetical protein [Bacteroidales bacterium]
MISKKIEIPIYDQNLVVVFYSQDEFEELRNLLFSDYNINLEENNTLGAVYAKGDTGHIITWIDIDRENILAVISHESMHLAGKVFMLIGQEIDLQQSEIMAYLTGWMFQTILDILPKEKIKNRKIA